MQSPYLVCTWSWSLKNRLQVATMHHTDEAFETLHELAADGVLSIAHLHAQWDDQVLGQTKLLKKIAKK
jgi:hypothetical protein